MKKMKGVHCRKYGPPEVLEIREFDKPVPKDNEVLIRVKASAVTQSDIFLRSSEIPLRMLIPMRIALGIFKPRRPIIGLVLSGIVEEAGKNVTRFASGDEVYGLSGFTLRAYAEYICLKVKDSVYGCLATKPKNLSHEEATIAAYGGLLALQFMEKANIQPGMNVLIYGASSNTGTLAVQVAKHLGASVTGVCSTKNTELVRSLGADSVLDYTSQKTLPEGTKYDFVLDAVGKMKSSPLKIATKKALTTGGIYSSIDDSDLKLDSARLDQIREYAEAGIFKPVIDRIYKLEDIVEAHRFVGKGHKVGGVPITI